MQQVVVSLHGFLHSIIPARDCCTNSHRSEKAKVLRLIAFHHNRSYCCSQSDKQKGLP